LRVQIPSATPLKTPSPRGQPPENTANYGKKLDSGR
jgi:hypothetical protein